jgi:hypothetical protein
VTAVVAPVPPPPSTPAVDDSEGDAETENDGTMPALRRGARGQVAKKKG